MNTGRRRAVEEGREPAERKVPGTCLHFRSPLLIRAEAAAGAHVRVTVDVVEGGIHAL